MRLSGSNFPPSYKALLVIPTATLPNSVGLHKILVSRTVGLRTSFPGCWDEDYLVLQVDIELLQDFLHHFSFQFNSNTSQFPLLFPRDASHLHKEGQAKVIDLEIFK